MGCLDARPLPIDLAPGVGEVALDVLDVAGRDDLRAALAALLEALEDVVLDLDVPGEVVLAGLEHGPRGGGGVAAALHLDRVEERPIGDVIVRVDLAADGVAGLEVDEAIRPGADRFEIRRRLA